MMLGYVELLQRICRHFINWLMDFGPLQCALVHNNQLIVSRNAAVQKNVVAFTSNTLKMYNKDYSNPLRYTGQNVVVHIEKSIKITCLIAARLFSGASKAAPLFAIGQYSESQPSLFVVFSSSFCMTSFDGHFNFTNLLTIQTIMNERSIHGMETEAKWQQIQKMLNKKVQIETKNQNK
jgi:hypothetical protein